MIYYETGRWGLGFVFTLYGSVFPTALVCAVPSGTLAVIMHILFARYADEYSQLDDRGIQLGMSSYNYVLGFLLVFRTQQAYSRWWEGGTLLSEIRAEWFSAYSSLIAFVSKKEDMNDVVLNFQHLLVRMMSLLFVSAIHHIAEMENEEYEVLDLEGVDLECMSFLKDCSNRVELILQWIQQMVVDGKRRGVIDIDAPILSRVFQELSLGMVKLQSAKKISNFPFPFPYAQTITVMLQFHWMTMPIVTAMFCKDAWWAGALTFIAVFSFWGLNYIACEIEKPFGDDPNDLPVKQLQTDFNSSLVSLMSTLAQRAPKFDPNRNQFGSVKSDEEALSPLPEPMESKRRGLDGSDLMSHQSARRLSVLKESEVLTAMNSNESRSEEGDPLAGQTISVKTSGLKNGRSALRIASELTSTDDRYDRRNRSPSISTRCSSRKPSWSSEVLVRSFKDVRRLTEAFRSESVRPEALKSDACKLQTPIASEGSLEEHLVECGVRHPAEGAHLEQAPRISPRGHSPRTAAKRATYLTNSSCSPRGEPPPVSAAPPAGAATDGAAAVSHETEGVAGTGSAGSSSLVIGSASVIDGTTSNREGNCGATGHEESLGLLNGFPSSTGSPSAHALECRGGGERGEHKSRQGGLVEAAAASPSRAPPDEPPAQPPTPLHMPSLQ